MSLKEKVLAIIYLFRLERTTMVTTITATAAVLSGAVWQDILWITFAGWCLAVSGFSLDFCADRELDKLAPRARIRRNPISITGSVIKNVRLYNVLIPFSFYYILSIVTKFPSHEGRHQCPFPEGT